MTERFPKPDLEQAIRDKFKYYTNEALIERYISLATAIQCAIDNGWQLPDERKGWDIGELAEWLVNMDVYQRYIFAHNFAKALWGDELERDESREGILTERWIIHLRETVLADDPIAYLGKHLKGADQ